jgi:glycine betaine/proline transport system substrate-binding protein
VQNFQITNQDMGEMVGLVDLEGKKVDAVVEDWITANKGKWSQWTQCK